jgi:hypothetical protein
VSERRGLVMTRGIVLVPAMSVPLWIGIYYVVNFLFSAA